jgi:predicted PurR-regulated permease PerM
MTDSTSRLPAAAAFWAIFAALALSALWLFSDILLPFAAGFVLAYLLHPAADRLSRLGLPRGAAAFVIIVAVALLIAAILALIAPPLFNQISQLIGDLPGYYRSASAYLMKHYGQYLQPAQAQKPGTGTVADVQQQIVQNVGPWLIAKLEGLLKSGLALFNSLALLVLTPVVTFFLLRDWDGMIASIQKFFPRKDAPVINQLAREIDSTISGYFRGTLIVLAIVSAFYMVALGLIGLNYGLLIGLGAGLFSFVPYLGSTAGFVVSGGVAMAQYWPDYTKIGLVCGIFVFGQLMEGNVLTPNIVGNKVRLHPVWLLFALIASGYLLGFTGLLISVPLAAVTGVLVRHAIHSYYESPIYKGEGNREHNLAGAGTEQG